MEQLLWAIVMAVVSYAISPRPPKPKDAIEDKLEIPAPPRGEPIPVVFGTVWIKDAGVIYYGNPHQEKIETKGGKK